MTACMDLPCEWAQFLYVCAERGLEDSAIILIATWHREGPAITQRLNMNHGHPDGDLLTSILAYEWFLDNKRHYNQKYADWRTAWNQEWKACTEFPEAPKRHFGSPGYSTLLLHSVWSTSRHNKVVHGLLRVHLSVTTPPPLSHSTEPFGTVLAM